MAKNDDNNAKYFSIRIFILEKENKTILLNASSNSSEDGTAVFNFKGLFFSRFIFYTHRPAIHDHFWFGGGRGRKQGRWGVVLFKTFCFDSDFDWRPYIARSSMWTYKWCDTNDHRFFSCSFLKEGLFFFIFFSTYFITN